MRTSFIHDLQSVLQLEKLVSAVSIILLLFSVSCSPEGKRSPDSLAETPPDSTLIIRDAWLRPASEGGTAAGYLTIFNGKATADTLLGISASAARTIEVHESYRNEEGLSGMRPAGKIAIEAGSSLELKPGGYHIMFMGLNRDLAVGDSLSLTFYFTQNDSIEVRVPVMMNRS